MERGQRAGRSGTGSWGQRRKLREACRRPWLPVPRAISPMTCCSFVDQESKSFGEGETHQKVKGYLLRTLGPKSPLDLD